MIFSVFDNYRQTIEIDEIYYDLELADTAGQVDYEQVRLVSNLRRIDIRYTRGDSMILTFHMPPLAKSQIIGLISPCQDSPFFEIFMSYS